MESVAMTAGDRLAEEFDPRLAEVWLDVFAFGLEHGSLPEEFGWFLRMAYLKGYEDALTEPKPGSLYRKLGITQPARKASGKAKGARK